MDDVEGEGRDRRALWLSSGVITLIVLLQAPGRIVPETKLDVLLDPVGYLGRALSAWDPSGGFGRVQNQAIGYLFPMGAFTALGHALSVPPWLVQRLWISLVIVLSLWGAHRVARAVGVSSSAGRLVAAWAYALAPATLSITAFQSAGQLPYALAPHVLVPLLTAKEGASPRRVAAASALWIAAMGGVNGAAAFAVLPLVVIWFTTRAPGPARRRLLGWWLAGALAATLWWLIPLLVSVRYGIRFTDFTETSSLTTWTESGTEILRGTGNWLSFVQTDGGSWLPGAWSLTADRVAILGSVAVAAGGMWGLARRASPGRSWLLPSFVLGTVAMGIGYAGAWGGPLSGLAQQLLDGPLVPFRNVHKFSAVVHLPLALGLGHLVTVAVDRARAAVPSSSTGAASAAGAPAGAPARVGRTRLARAVPALAAVAIALAVLPAAGQLTAPGSFTDVPATWRDAATWLDAHDDGQRSLLLPGSAFGEYEWGRPLDEPISSLLHSDWAVRDLIPLGGNGSTRMLDGIDTALQSDALPPGFLTTLQRSGVRYLVVRNDLDLVRTGGPRPASVRRLLRTVPEIQLVASFGPAQSDPGSDLRVASPPGQAATEAFRAIDIYEVPGAVDRVTGYPAAGAAVTSGGPEAVLDLEPHLTDGRAVVLAVDDGAADLPDPLLVATDTARRRDVRFGAIRDNATYTLTADQDSPLTGDAPVDRWPSGTPEGLTSARVDGAASLTDSRKPQQSMRPEQQPFAAFDGNRETAWGPAKGRTGEWVQVQLDQPTDVGAITVRIPETTGKRIGSVRIETDQGSQVAKVGPDGTASVNPPAGKTSRVRVVIDSITGTRGVARVGISEIEIGGVHIDRPLVVPSPSPEGAEVVSLARDHYDRFSLTRHDEEGDLDRVFTWGGSAQAQLHGTASAAPGHALDALVAQGVGPAHPSDVQATATSVFGDQPAFVPGMAVDGDPQTGWISAAQADAPAITLKWQGAVPVDGLQIDMLDKVADPVHRVVVTVGGVDYDRELTASGQVSIPSTDADELTVSFPSDPGDRTNARQVAVGEISVPAIFGRTAATPKRATRVALPCGEGPPVSVDGTAVATRAEATVGQLLDGSPIAWTACSPTQLDRGPNRVTATAGALLVSTLAIEPEGGIPAPPAARTATAGRWGREDRTIRVAAGGDAIVATTENFNDGWEATLDGQALTPIRVDGWRQGWRVPAGSAATIHLRYRPGTSQRLGLVLGLVALLALLAAAAVPARRRAGADRATWVPPALRPWAAPATCALIVLAGVSLGGPLVLLAVPLVVLPRRSRWLPVVAAAATGCAGLVTFIWAGADVGDHTGTFSGPAQGFAVLAILAVAVALLPSPPDEEPA
ncbi:alpha-(1-_3)-arabinofuranosyltransferase domain-containing protein [Aquihabitans sp. McL0605]|uniref:alpha-(1->3)-arabinofuranosyltransferase domain-containing protein n=1 Tax=Aquihabitans sp. McL0605 TaxID=3415671 RepID=UPI003CE6743F